MIWLYRLLFFPALVLALPYYLLRIWRRGGYAKDFQHRFGAFHRLPSPRAGSRRIWIQAVSVGEVAAVGPLINAVLTHGNFEIVLTSTTSTGYREARKRYGERIFSVGVFPLDFWLFSRLAWRRIQPDVILLTESELWPEHLHQASRRGVPAFLINARMSDRSFQRYAKVPKLTQRILRKFKRIYPASETDQQRFLNLGAEAYKVEFWGSIKLDGATPAPMDRSARRQCLADLALTSANEPDPLVLLGASTWPGEEAVLLEIVNRLIASGVDCRLILVPRHAERAPEIRPLLDRQALTWHQRSTGPGPEHRVSVLLADTTGELAWFTGLADIAFIGKSLPPNKGGQSPIDAAALGVPVLVGPHMNNFADIARSLLADGAAIRVEDATDLEAALSRLSKDPALRQQMGAAGQAWHNRHRGSSERIADSILTNLDSCRS